MGFIGLVCVQGAGVHANFGSPSFPTVDQLFNSFNLQEQAMPTVGSLSLPLAIGVWSSTHCSIGESFRVAGAGFPTGKRLSLQNMAACDAKLAGLPGSSSSDLHMHCHFP